MRHRAPPWHEVRTIVEALAMVEDAARERGWREPRRAIWSASQVEDCEHRLGLALPAEVRALARRYDPVCWGWFQISSDTDEGPAHPADPTEQIIRIHEPGEWRVDEKQPPTIEDQCIREFGAEHCGTGRAFASEWRDCRFLRLGSTVWIDALLVCVAGPEDAVGRVGITVMDDPQVLFPARSLRRWLAMLATTGLNDLVLSKPPDELLRSEDGAAAAEEFSVLNPHCDWYR